MSAEYIAMLKNQIDALQAEVDGRREHAKIAGDRIDELTAEVARLRAAAKTVVEVYWNFDRSMEGEIKALQKLLELSPVQTVSDKTGPG